MRKTIKVKEVITRLRASGNIVNYRKRSDGGYLITSINGAKYKGAKGNTAARSMIGVSLTKGQASQRTQAFSRSPLQFKKNIRNAIKRAKSEYKKSSYEFFSTAKPSVESIKANIKYMGTKGALNALENNIRRAQGYAYAGNVEALIQRIQNVDTKGDFADIVSMLYSKADVLPDADLVRIYQIFYAHEEGSISTATAVSQVNDILD